MRLVLQVNLCNVHFKQLLEEQTRTKGFDLAEENQVPCDEYDCKLDAVTYAWATAQIETDAMGAAALNSQAAAALGRRGGAVASEAQKAAARENGKKGGRPVGTTRKNPIE